MIRQLAMFAACPAMLAMACTSQATILGFGQLGGNNTTIPVNFGSNATADANGLVVSNGTTPDITITWDINGDRNSGSGNAWDIHTSGNFSVLEDANVGGGAWDNEGNVPRVAQLDFGLHSIGFAAAPGAQLVLNSFDFGHTAETAGDTEWSLVLTDSASTVVWSQTVTFTGGMTQTIAPNFTGLAGEDYILAFERTSSTYPSDGRHGIDNLSFNQVPEPTACVLAVLGGLTLMSCSRRKEIA